MKNIIIPNEVLEIIRLTVPEKAMELDKDHSLESIVNITKKWAILPEDILKSNFEDKFFIYHDKILQAAMSLGLRKTKNPSFTEYNCAVILGSTGLSHFKIWKDLIFFYINKNIKFSKIYILGGNRPVNHTYDSLGIAYKYFPEYFIRQLADKEILKCHNEMEIMELITSTIKLPKNLKKLPIISVFTKPPNNIQADSYDKIAQLLKDHNLSLDLPILFMGTLPYIIREGIQAELLMPSYTIDTAAIFEPYLETIDTPLKGELPPALYLDELHRLLSNMAKIKG